MQFEGGICENGENFHSKWEFESTSVKTFTSLVPKDGGNVDIIFIVLA